MFCCSALFIKIGERSVPIVPSVNNCQQLMYPKHPEFLSLFLLLYSQITYLYVLDNSKFNNVFLLHLCCFVFHLLFKYSSLLTICLLHSNGEFHSFNTPNTRHFCPFFYITLLNSTQFFSTVPLNFTREITIFQKIFFLSILFSCLIVSFTFLKTSVL